MVQRLSAQAQCYLRESMRSITPQGREYFLSVENALELLFSAQRVTPVGVLVWTILI